jgi:phage replication initiation protein
MNTAKKLSLIDAMQMEADRTGMVMTFDDDGQQISVEPTPKSYENQALNNYPPIAGQDKKDLNPSSSNTRGKRGTDYDKALNANRGRVALIDWLTIVIPDVDFLPTGVYDHDQFIESVNRFFLSYLGLSASPTLRGGKNFYSHSWEILDKSQNIVGFVAHGGNKDTVCINLTGTACCGIGSAGYLFVYNHLKEFGGRITRIDLAHDFYDGEITIQHVIDWHKNGMFKTKSGRGAYPSIRGHFDFGSGAGNTVEVGNRQSGKMLRAYEKGKQLGDKNSPWLRIELELRNTDREIPYEILRDEASYLAGAYLCLQGFAPNQSYVKTQQKTTLKSIAEPLTVVSLWQCNKFLMTPTN